MEFTNPYYYLQEKGVEAEQLRIFLKVEAKKGIVLCYFGLVLEEVCGKG